MRYVSFRVEGRASYGVVRGRGVLDLGARMGGLLPDLRRYLEALALGFEPPRLTSQAEDYSLEDIEYLPVCQPAKILCVGHNYEKHRSEMGRSKADYPTVFTRFADTLVGHGAAIIRPHLSTALDYEGELAVVIGRPAHRVPAARAMDVVAGYACFNDGSVRDWQRHTGQFTPGKNFPSTAALGPELVTPDEVGRLDDLSIETRLNGTVMQSATLGEMIFPVAELIAYISAFAPLSAGDVIATGTPGGVGAMRDPPVFMKDGDVIEVLIEKVGHLKNQIAGEAGPAD